MVVLPSIQAVYDFGQILRARAKIQKTALGKPFVIGSIFSLRYESFSSRKNYHYERHMR